MAAVPQVVPEVPARPVRQRAVAAQDTWTRLAPLAGDRFLVVTGRAHQHEVREQLPAVGPDGVLAEPSLRDSMAAIGLAAALLERADPDAVMGRSRPTT